MTIDLNGIFKRLRDRGFVKLSTSKGIYKGIAYCRMQNLDVSDFIRYFNSVFRGLWNYYSFVDNSSSLQHVWWALHESLAFTLSRKDRMTGIRKVFQKYGYPIKDQTGKVIYWRPLRTKK